MFSIQNIVGAQTATIIELWDHIKELREQQSHLIKTFHKARAPDMEGEDQVTVTYTPYTPSRKFSGNKASRGVKSQKTRKPKKD